MIVNSNNMKDTIVSGPKCDFDEFRGSVAEYLIPKIKAQGPDNVMLVSIVF